MEFFMPMVPPTRTEQQHRVVFSKTGHPVFLRDPKLQKARELLAENLKPHIPEKPFEEPLAVSIFWVFPYKKSIPKKKIGKVIPKDTRPDIDNLNKNLLDVMNGNYWNDDSQVVRFTSAKAWYSEPGIFIRITPLDEERFDSQIQQAIRSA